MAKRQTKNKRKRSVLAPSPPQMVILRVCMVLLALLLAAITLLNRGSDTVMNTAYPRKYDEYVTYYAGKYQIDPYILYSIIRTESNFNPQAESNVGARGLMQITEITFDWIKTKIAPDEPLTFDDLYDPEVNIRFGSYFISYCLQRDDDDLGTAARAASGASRGAPQPVFAGWQGTGCFPVPANAPLCAKSNGRICAVQ